MRSRALLTLIASSLFFVLVACSNKPATDSAANAADQNAPAGGENGSTAGSTRAPAGKAVVVVPTGTTLTVRLGEALGSKISSPGQSFTATLVAPVAVGGNTVIPAGVEARGTVTDAKALGRFKGGAVLQIKLNSIKVNGVEHSIDTSAVTRSAKGKGKRTAVLTGGIEAGSVSTGAYHRRWKRRRHRGPGRRWRRWRWISIHRQQRRGPTGRVRSKLQTRSPPGTEINPA